MPIQNFWCCFLFKRTFKILEAKPPEDVKKLFSQYSKNDTMTIEDLQRFLIDIQGETNATKDDAQLIFNSLRHLNIFHRRGLHLDAFFRYLLSRSNSPLPSEVHQDMNAPLAHYFLYTGHNSYLTGNQLNSDCSVEPIIDALKRGVRVIELDLWPNCSEDDVEVRHGRAFTKPVPLGECLHAIKDYAFLASEYPLVITFEEHLKPELQDLVAKMVIRTFKGMLPSPMPQLSEEFSSPASLKRKILISTKPPKEYLEKETVKEERDRKNVSEVVKEDLWAMKKTEEDDQSEREHLDEGNEQTEIPKYRSLIAIHAMKLKGGFKDFLDTDHEKARRLSISEQKLQENAVAYGTDIVRFTQKMLLRVYPKGSRIDSSNYNPLVGWMHGAQMVAFNMQGHGKYLWIMQGMFRANGGCGYVKKPKFLLDDINVFDPKADRKVRTVLKVKVYMGIGWDMDFPRTKFDFYSPPDFFAKVAIAGVPEDSLKKKTKALEDQWTPTWNEEFEFPLTVPELALLRVEVYDNDTDDDDFAGQTCLPVWELKAGIRAIPLYSRKGEMYRSVTLLMGFHFESVPWSSM